MTHEMTTAYQLIPDEIWAKGEEKIYINHDQFCITVTYQGLGKWRVVQGLSSQGYTELSRAGNWYHVVPRFKRDQYRFDSFEEALEAARKALPEIRRFGRTWQEEEEFFKTKWAAEEAAR